MGATVWHAVFLIAMGFLTSFLLFQKIAAYTSTYSSGTDIPIDYGFQLLCFGALYGAVDYLSGVALSLNKETLLEMVSYTADKFYKTSTISTTYTDPFYG